MSTHIGTGYPVAPLVPAVDWATPTSCEHSVQFYDDEAFILEELSRYIGSALGAGDAGIVIATKAHRDGLAQRLAARGLDLAGASAQGRYVALDAAETLSMITTGGWPDAARFASVVGGIITRVTAATGARPQIAIFGEMVALLWLAGQPEAAIQLEQLWNDLAQTQTFSLRCAYPMSLFGQAGDGEPLRRICAAHTQVIPAESYTSLANEEQRLHAITLWQQKAHALEAEVAERKKVEQALRDSNQELRDALQARERFLSVAAHELKTPITGLLGFAQLLLRDARRQREIAPARLEAALETIERQTGKLSQLVTHLLDTTQIEAGKLRIEPTRTDLVALIQATLAQQHGGAMHMFVFEGPSHFDAMVDAVRFEQVITNLLDNAVKFSPHGGRVAVGLKRGDDGGIRLSVTDQGVGIPPGQREAVFDRFHQAHGERHLSGLGLGLHITREIVELHGGLVWIEQPEHRGARFVVALPPTAVC